MTLTEWLDWQRDVAVQRMLANILPNGAVIGAPDPKMEYYQFHWLRDSSISFDLGTWNGISVTIAVHVPRP